MYVDEDRTFFCSELVAKAYKILSVIEDDETSCSCFYPADFSSKKSDLKFKRKDIFLERELSIVINIK